MALPHSVIKKDGHIMRFRKKLFLSSLRSAARHAHYTDENTLYKAEQEILLHLSNLGLTQIPVATIRKEVVGVLREHHLGSVRDAYEFTFLHTTPIHIHTVTKRDGESTAFHPHKIFKSLVKVIRETGKGTPQDAEYLTKQILGRLATRFSDETTISTKAIRAVTEEVLGTYRPAALDAYRFNRYR